MNDVVGWTPEGAHTGDCASIGRLFPASRDPPALPPARPSKGELASAPPVALM